MSAHHTYRPDPGCAGYDSRCGMCWLGHSHTCEQHNAAVARAQTERDAFDAARATAGKPPWRW